MAGLGKLHDEISYHMCFATPSNEAAVAKFRGVGLPVKIHAACAALR